MEVSWPVFKDFVDARQMSIQWVDIDNTYWLMAFSGPFKLSCKIYKIEPEGNALTEFESSYKAAGNKFIPSVSQALDEPNGFRFRGTRIVAQAMQVGTTTVDYTVSEERYLTGAVVKAYGAGHFDYVTFQVVAPAGHSITGGAPIEVVLDAFAPSWGISDELQLIDLYKARVYAGLIIRIIYHNTAAAAVDVWVNAFLHKKV